MKRLTRLLHDSSGATAIEYALVASLISIFIVGAVGSVGSTVSTLFYGPIDSALAR
jgi:Flp pilus assembly pilin Flp